MTRQLFAGWQLSIAFLEVKKFQRKTSRPGDFFNGIYFRGWTYLHAFKCVCVCVCAGVGGLQQWDRKSEGDVSH